MATSKFIDDVRQELSGLPLEHDSSVRGELTAVVSLIGTVAPVEGGGASAVRVVTRSGAVARRTHALFTRRYQRPSVTVISPSGPRGIRRYEVRLEGAGSYVSDDLGLDRYADTVGGLEPQALTGFLRGALLSSASISTPGRPPHLEFAVPSLEVGHVIADLIVRELGASGRLTADRRPRVVIKSGAVIGELLVRGGVSAAFLRWDDQLFRRDLRSQANRLANADSANVQRSIQAASVHVWAVEVVVGERGWDGLDPQLRDVALARMANPEASLSELAELVDPPIGRSAVHRRLRQIVALAQQITQADQGSD